MSTVYNIKIMYICNISFNSNEILTEKEMKLLHVIPKAFEKPLNEYYWSMIFYKDGSW